MLYSAGNEIMTSEKEIAAAADDIYDRLRQLRGPKDAAMALLVAHLRITLEQGMGTEEVSQMLKEYRAKFLGGVFGHTVS
jgi:hypothetical protein